MFHIRIATVCVYRHYATSTPPRQEQCLSIEKNSWSLEPWLQHRVFVVVYIGFKRFDRVGKENIAVESLQAFFIQRNKTTR